MEKSKIEFNSLKWIPWAVAIILVAIIVFFLILKNQYINTKIIEKKHESKEIKRSIDSIEIKQSKIIDSIINESNNDVKNSKKLIKTLPNEKANVRPVDYDSMCKFISNYRPK